jgi:hypothetical protein
MFRSRIELTLAVVALMTTGTVACSSSDSKSSGGAGGASATGGTGGGGGTLTTGGTGGTAGSTGGAAGSGGGPTCDPGPGFPVTDPPHTIDKLNGKVVELSGAPAKNTLAQVCGTDLCIYGSTDDQGVIATCDQQTKICAPGIIPGGKSFTRPAFKYGDGFGYAKFAMLLPTNTADYDVGTQITAALPALTSGAEMLPGSDAESGGVTLSIAAGGSVKIDTLTFTEPDEQKFRAVEIPIAQAPEAVDSSLGFEIVVGVTPLETEFCPHAKLTVPNTPGWAAGTEVEFFVHSVDPTNEWAPYAGWAKVSGGAVSSDGKSVSTADGEGLPILSTLAVRKK